MPAGPKPPYAQPPGHVAGEDDDDVVNDSLGTIDTADSTGTDDELETGDAKSNNFDTHED